MTSDGATRFNVTEPVPNQYLVNVAMNPSLKSFDQNSIGDCQSIIPTPSPTDATPIAIARYCQNA